MLTTSPKSEEDSHQLEEALIQENSIDLSIAGTNDQPVDSPVIPDNVELCQENISECRTEFLASLTGITGPNSKCFSEEKRLDFINKLLSCAVNGRRLPSNLRGYALGDEENYWEIEDWTYTGPVEDLELWTNKSTSSSSLNRGLYRRVIQVEKFFDIIFENHRSPEGAYLGQKKVFEKLKDRYACLPRDAVDRYISTWRKVFKISDRVKPSGSVSSIIPGNITLKKEAQPRSNMSSYSFSGVSMVPRQTAAETLNLSNRRLEDLRLEPMTVSGGGEAIPVNYSLAGSNNGVLKRDSEDSDGSNMAPSSNCSSKRRKLANGSKMSPSSCSGLDNENSSQVPGLVVNNNNTTNYTSKEETDMEMACNLTLRKFVDELLDRTVTFCNQPKERITRLEELLQSLFPGIDPMRLRGKIRSYLKACRRNSKKHNGTVQMKGTPSHLTSDRAKLLMAEIYQRSKEKLDVIKLIQEEASIPTAINPLPDANALKQGGQYTADKKLPSSENPSNTSATAAAMLSGMNVAGDVGSSDNNSNYVDPMVWSLGTLMEQNTDNPELVQSMLSLHPLMSGGNSASSVKAVREAVQRSPEKARQFMETLRHTATFLIFSASQLEMILNGCAAANTAKNKTTAATAANASTEKQTGGGGDTSSFDDFDVSDDDDDISDDDADLVNTYVEDLSRGTPEPAPLVN